MTQVIINGKDYNYTLSNQSNFQDLMELLRSQLDSQNSLISRIRIDGAEVLNTEDEKLATTPLLQFKSIEFFTAHPKEIADETLQNLLSFTQVLIDLSVNCGSEMGTAEFQTLFARLLDGVSTFIDALSSVKQILRVSLFNPNGLLEAELLGTLENLSLAQEWRDPNRMKEILTADLPHNLKQWKEKGLPTLIRCRDS